MIHTEDENNNWLIDCWLTRADWDKRSEVMPVSKKSAIGGPTVKINITKKNYKHMTTLQLYKFINDGEGIEWRWDTNNDKDDVVIWVPFYKMEDFVKIISPSFFDERSVPVVLRDNTIALCMREICEDFDIELEEIFPKEK